MGKGVENFMDNVCQVKAMNMGILTALGAKLVG
jgi:hypothetical protein